MTKRTTITQDSHSQSTLQSQLETAFVTIMVIPLTKATPTRRKKPLWKDESAMMLARSGAYCWGHLCVVCRVANWCGAVVEVAMLRGTMALMKIV
jgi:hypothetical protein